MCRRRISYLQALSISKGVFELISSRWFAVLAAVVVTACSGGGGGSSTLTPSIPTNIAPVIVDAIADQSATIGTPFSFDVTQGGATFSDADGDGLTIAVSFNPATFGLSASAGQISGTPIQAGTVGVTVTASDPSGANVAATFDIVISVASTPTKPNILLIIADDLGQDSSAQYSLSSDQPNTPTLDQLAGDGLIFENLWVNPTCSPTRASLISSKYGERTGVLTPGDALPAGETILQAYLDADPATTDYASAMVGKWHLGGSDAAPNNFGIDHYAGIIGGGVGDYFNWSLVVNGTSSTSTEYVTTELTNQAIDWIDLQSDPWFLWLAYNAPHTPFHLPPADLHNRTSLSGTTADIDANPRDYYLAAIEALDTEIGRLLDSMTAQERADTIILFIGDNGTPASVRDRTVFPQGAKGSLFEGGVRVPMIASGAGVTRQGERERALINGVDFYTTIFELAGGTQPVLNDSVSFVSLLDAAGAGDRDYIYSEDDTSFAVRGSRYKLIEDLTGVQYLYDLDTDPTEQTDLLTTATDLTAILADLGAARDAIR